MIGAFSETASPGTPSTECSLRPNIHAAPSTSKTMHWHAECEVWIETAFTSLRERRMWGSRRSGPLPDALSIPTHANEPKAEPPRRTQALYSLHIIRVFLRAFPAELWPMICLRASPRVRGRTGSYFSGDGSNEEVVNSHQSVPPQINTVRNDVST